MIKKLPDCLFSCPQQHLIPSSAVLFSLKRQAPVPAVSVETTGKPHCHLNLLRASPPGRPDMGRRLPSFLLLCCFQGWAPATQWWREMVARSVSRFAHAWNQCVNSGHIVSSAPNPHRNSPWPWYLLLPCTRTGWSSRQGFSGYHLCSEQKGLQIQIRCTSLLLWLKQLYSFLWNHKWDGMHLPWWDMP